MARTAVVRSASLAPDDAALADELAVYLAGGSFSQLTQMLLRTVGEPLRRRISELRESGIEPQERLFTGNAVPGDTDEQIARFYALSSWPVVGPKGE